MIYIKREIKSEKMDRSRKIKSTKQGDMSMMSGIKNEVGENKQREQGVKKEKFVERHLSPMLCDKVKLHE